MNHGKIHIQYIFRSFPNISELFLVNEIIGMIKWGMKVSIVSLHKPSGLKQIHDDIIQYGLLDKTYYLNLPSGIKKTKNIIIRTLYGQVKLFFIAKIPLRSKIEVSIFSLKNKKRRITLANLVDHINHIALEKPDLLYFHFATHAGDLIILRKIFKIPFVVYMHGYDFSKNLPYDELNYPEMFRYGDWFFTNSNYSAGKIIKLGCPDSKLSVVGLPLDENSYPFQIRQRRSRIKILTVGRLVEKKGMEYSIRAVERLVKGYPELEYNIIGTGQLEKYLKDLIDSLQMEKNIFLLGSMTKSEVIRYLLDSDIFVLSSITAMDGDTEGLGMVLLEAQLTGMPVVATLHNGFTDAVKDGVSGFLVPEKDVDALYNRLKWLIENPQEWESLGRAGREHIIANYSEKDYMGKITERLKSIIK